jgi:sugar O-acyltransferase (sialic acid O-acetyltransferase NeuD family)
VKVIIVGAGQNGGQVYNILKLDKEVTIVGFLDDDPDKQGTEKYGLPVFGAVSTVESVAAKHGVRGAIVAVGNNGIRGRMTKQLRKAGLCIVSAIHTHAFIDDTAQIGQGSIIEMGAMVHPESRIGEGVFVGGSTVVAHDCVIGDYTLLGGGVVFGGDVVVEAYATLGVGTILQPHVRIGRNVTTGIGTVVVKDLPDNAVAVGVPAKILRFQVPVREE